MHIVTVLRTPKGELWAWGQPGLIPYSYRFFSVKCLCICLCVWVSMCLCSWVSVSVLAWMSVWVCPMSVCLCNCVNVCYVCLSVCLCEYVLWLCVSLKVCPFVCVCVPCVYVWMSKEARDIWSSEAEISVAVSCLMWVLGVECGYSGRVIYTELCLQSLAWAQSWALFHTTNHPQIKGDIETQ